MTYKFLLTNGRAASISVPAAFSMPKTRKEVSPDDR